MNNETLAPFEHVLIDDYVKWLRDTTSVEDTRRVRYRLWRAILVIEEERRLNGTYPNSL